MCIGKLNNSLVEMEREHAVGVHAGRGSCVESLVVIIITGEKAWMQIHTTLNRDTDRVRNIAHRPIHKGKSMQ